MNTPFVNPITSCADILYKSEMDDKYKQILRYSCFRATTLIGHININNFNTTGYEKSKKWLEDWTSKNVPLFYGNCNTMVNYINKSIELYPFFIKEQTEFHSL